MPFPPSSRPLPVLASTLAAAGLVLAVAGCSHVTPLGPDQAPPSLPPQRHLGSPVTLQVMRSQQPTAPGPCPAGTVDVFGMAPVPRAVVAHHVRQRAGQGTPSPAATPAAAPAPLVGIACYRPVGRPVTITSGAVSSVAAYPRPPGAQKEPITYGFVVAVPATDVAAVTAVIKQAYDSRDAVGISVAGKLWQAPRVAQPFPGQRFYIALLSRHQAVQLHRLLVPSG